MTAMTVAERTELGKLVRLRCKVAKGDLDALAARRLVEVERELATIYSPTAEAWAEVNATAKAAVAEADRIVAAKCAALGIRAEFRPGLNVYWHGRGENGSKERRTELRRVAQTEIAAHLIAAKQEVERYAAEQLSALATGALGSDAARAFLDNMPSIDALLPAPTVARLEAALPLRRGMPWAR